MSESLSIRRYHPDDHERVLALHGAAMREVGAYAEGVPDPDLADIEGVYSDAGGEFLVGELEDEVVVMGAFRPVTGYLTEFLDDLPEATAEVKWMRVEPEHWRRGYGTHLYRELERRARERGFTDLVLDTTPGQAGARALYEGEGFELVHRTRVCPGEEPFELLVYRKSLTPGE